MEIFIMIRGFCLKWTGSCRSRSKVASLLSSDQNVKQLLQNLFAFEFFYFLLDLELVKKNRLLMGITIELAT